LKLLSFGEILWDIIEEKEYIGGAPFNLAVHAAKMGMESYLISSVGKDERGAKALEIAGNFGLNLSFITQHDKKPTGTVDVVLKKGQPDYIINTEVAWDEIILKDSQIRMISSLQWDGFCFGTLAQRTEHNRALLNKLFPEVNAKQILYDINLRQNYYDIAWIRNSLEYCTIVKLNDEEAAVISELLYHQLLGIEELSKKMSADFNLDIVCITQGEKGAYLYAEGELKEIPGVKVDVVNTVGSGDSFSAGFLYVYLLTGKPFEAGEFACQLGAYTATFTGAIPEYDDEIIKELKKIK